MGLVIGKFMPPHLGHLRLIETARRHVHRLTVILFSKRHEPIPGEARLEWLRRLLPDLEILHVTDEHAVDFDDPSLWEAWVASIRQVYPFGPDVVFSSEAYGDELARRLGAVHHCVDRDRAAVPVSATAIRADPLAHWEYLPACVRPYFVIRIAIVGAESTGKTTLARDLSQALGTVWAPEFAREYLEAKGAPCAWEDMELIARGQIECEEQQAEKANRFLVCDTTLRVTRAWSDYYFGACAPWIANEAERRPYHLHLVTGLDVPWQGDGLRDCPHERHLFHDRFVHELKEAGLPLLILNGSREARLHQSLRACAALGPAGAAERSIPGQGGQI